MMRNQTGNGFNLVMELEDPQRLGELTQWLDEKKPQIRKTFGELGYVHFARFLPIPEKGLLLIVSEFDGDAKDYVMDFAAVLDEAFTKILSYMKNRPRLPVRQYPDEFWAYVDRYTKIPLPNGELKAHPDPYSAYPGLSVTDITSAARVGMLAGTPRTIEDAAVRAAASVDERDVQANVLRGYRARRALHLGFEFPTGFGAGGRHGAAGDRRVRSARALLAELIALVTPHSAGGEVPACMTLGLTHAGLQALGLPQATLDDFPVAFREGPRVRAERLGDTGRNSPDHWNLGSLGKSATVVHGIVSILARSERDFDRLADRVRELIGPASIRFERDAQALGDQGDLVHFGYRDGFGQPRFEGLPDQAKQVPPAQRAVIGDLLLGRDYPNSRGSRFIGELPPALATHGTYAAFRVIEQDTEAFEKLLDRVQTQYGVERELTAAKLMGRWRNGSPLVLNPLTPDPGMVEPDAFDYVTPAGQVDDRDGRRCPIGSHIRRLNPRSGTVVGLPMSRRIVRRGMPYGPPHEAGTSAGTPGARRTPTERGLAGLFLCGDLESQFEFVQGVWANGDLSAPGLRQTQDPIVGARECDTPFRFRPREAEAEITIMVPPLTRTRGSAYLFMPGIAGLRWLAGAGWETDTQTPAQHRADWRTKVNIDRFEPTDPQFLADPYPFYAAFRERHPVCRIEAPYDAWWVFSHKLVTEVCERRNEFLKPGQEAKLQPRPVGVVNSQLDDGLFYMNPERHTCVRKMLDPIFESAIHDARNKARALAGRLLEAERVKGQMDMVGGFASKLASAVYMDVMGIPPEGTEASSQEIDDERKTVDRWIRTTLHANDKALPKEQRAPGATTRMALYTYLHALGKEAGQSGPSERPKLLAAIQQRTGCPASALRLSPEEAANTAVHFALGGYLSTEFLIASGIYNLLRHPDQWQLLCRERHRIDEAVHEMLRFDAPFQIADRWVGKDTELNGQTIPGGSLVAVVYGSANRDPEKFPDPDRFDIARSNMADNLGFGHGIHYCIGDQLAKWVAGAAIEALIEHYPMARIAEQPSWARDPYFRSLPKLLVRWY
ncbi:MAG TPA: cytochrome P450 [Burkholderiaceae bacterium]|nr:cytochrome P450 [Burkholderiaceae bacterium]